MNPISENQLVYYCDSENGINTCGFRVNSILLQMGVSPITTVNTNKEMDTPHNIFDDMIVPNFALGYFSSHHNKPKHDDQESIPILDDNLYNKLYELMTNSQGIEKEHKKVAKTRNHHRHKKSTNRTKHRI